MASSRIALVAVIALLAATAVFSQDTQQEPPAQGSAADSSQSGAPKSRPVRVPGNVASAMLIHQVTPVYPAAAKEQHIEGTLLLHAIIGKDGTLQNLTYVSGPPILMNSAMDAVKQWQYKPTLLNGEPVEVDTTISVVYTLGGKTLKDAMDSALPQPASDAPPSDSSAPNSERIRVGGNVASASLVHQVTPVYPPLANTAHISGTVVLHALIAKDGTIEQLQVVSGPPLLLKSAMDAVRQWVYRPTLVNGDPVRVDTMISVVYALGEKNPNNAEGSGTPSDVPALQAELPPAPVSLAEVGPPYADSSDGMYKQFAAMLAARKSEDKQKFEGFLDNFALPDPKTWLTKTFGAEQGAALLPAYNESLKKFDSHIAWVSGNWANAPDLALEVEPSQLPKPPAESGSEAALPIPIVVPRIENFRFRIAGGELGLNEWVFSFIYLDGAFRIVGGTLTFWDEDLQRLRAPKSVAGIVTAATLVHQVTPAYPKSAKKKHIEGTVILHAIIAKDGAVRALEYVSGPPELTDSAMKAVKKWQYKPTLFNGDPIEVSTTISVVFTLGNH